MVLIFEDKNQNLPSKQVQTNTLSKTIDHKTE
jgi:hypothetical protein